MIATVDTLLSRLDKVKATGPNRWIACCPAHADKSPSLAIRELEDGRVILHCFAGCPTHDVLAAIGLEFSDLYPETDRCQTRPERRPFPAADILQCLAHEALVVGIAGHALRESQPLSDSDYERLNLAVQRIQAAVAVSGASHNG